MNFSTVHACTCLTIADWENDCAYCVFLLGRSSSHQEIILTTMPNCSDSTSSSYSPFSSASAFSSFCSGRFFIRFYKRESKHKQTHTHKCTHKHRERKLLLMQISFSVQVRIKTTSHTRLAGYHTQ